MVNIALSVTQLTTANVRSTVLQMPYRRAETPLLRRLDSEYMTFASSSIVLPSMITLHHRFYPITHLMIGARSPSSDASVEETGSETL